MSEMSIATCCEFVEEEINIPNDKHVIANNILRETNKNKLPLIGKSSTKTLSNKIVVILTNDKNK